MPEVALNSRISPSRLAELLAELVLLDYVPDCAEASVIRGSVGALRAIETARAHLRDAIACMQPEGSHQPMQHVRAALAALEGRPAAERPGESA